jgi:hypothetical protein
MAARVYKPFQGRIRQILTILSFIFMIVINVLASSGSYLGATAKQISDDNKNPFTPDGATFSVWGVIYAFWIIYVINQTLNSYKDNSEIDQISPFVIGSYLLNSLWLVVSAQRLWGISLVVIAFYLANLAKIYRILSVGRKSRTWREFFAITAPVSLNLSWVVAANFANLALTLTAYGWKVPSDFAMAEVFLVGSIASYVLFLRRDIPYALVAVWALWGIYRGQPDYSDVRKSCIAMISVSLISLLGGFLFNAMNPQNRSHDEEEPYVNQYV